MSVAVARALSLIGGSLALLVLGFFAASVLRALRGDEASRIAMHYGDRLIGVRAIEPRGTVADVREFEHLVRVAERTERMIMHADDGHDHTYVVEDGNLTLRYSIESGPQTLVPEEHEAPTPALEPEAPTPALEPEAAPTREPAPPAQPAAAEEDLPPVSAAGASRDGWSDSWTLSPARKR